MSKLHKNGVFFDHKCRCLEFETVYPMHQIFVEKITVFINFNRNVEQ